MAIFYRKIEQGKALIISGLGKPKVKFSGAIVNPFLDKVEVMDISVKTIEIDRRGKNGLICKDMIRADIIVSFYIRVNATEEDVKQVASMVGCERASDINTLETLFSAKFSEALKTAGIRMDFVELFDNRDQFKEEIIKVIGSDINGYSLEDAAIDYIEQTPLDALDEDNMQDSEGIRKITEITSKKHILTNEFEKDEEKEITRKNVETKETIYELERQQAEAEAKQLREIATAQAREESLTAQVQAEERLKAETAEKKTEEELGIVEENKRRAIELAAKGREREIGVESERVEQARELQATERERLVTIEQWRKDKDVEVEKKAIQEVIRERVALERSVAEEQEKIKDVEKIADAERTRQADVIIAEKDAQELLVRETVEAEAKEIAAKFIANETVILAEADKKQAEHEAEAAMVRAAAKIKVEAADGMAKVEVEKAEAEAIELKGRAEAIALREIKTAEADGTLANGTAEAKAKTAMYNSDAEGTTKIGTADAHAMAAKFEADANGINQKADAMKNFDGVGREHEEFKLELNLEERIKIAEIDKDRQVAEYQSEIMGEAMRSADIDIVGGDGVFLDNFFKSITLAKSVDAFVDESAVAKGFIDGENKIGEQLKNLIGAEGLKAADIKDLTVSALLAKLALEGKKESTRKVATSLQEHVSAMGLQDLMAMYLAK